MSGAVDMEGGAPLRGRGLAWFANPYVQIGMGAVLVTVSELLLKKGASETAGESLPEWMKVLGVGAMASGGTWLGIICYVLSFGSWLYVLRRLPLGLAFSPSHLLPLPVPT